MRKPEIFRSAMRLTRSAIVAGFVALTAIACAIVNQFDLDSLETLPTGLVAVDPSGWRCSPVTSLFGSLIDVDGKSRDIRHEGIDAGRLGEAVLAPADATVIALWETDNCCGKEYNLLLLHTRDDVNLHDGPPYYYSEFDHLDGDDVADLEVGDRIRRGQRIARVSRPGGDERYLAEVHWEVYRVRRHSDHALTWTTNDQYAPMWLNLNARLVDPLTLLSKQRRPSASGAVELPVYVEGRDYRNFKGFTYILPCARTGKIASSGDRRR